MIPGIEGAYDRWKYLPEKHNALVPGCRFEFQLLDCHRYAGSKKIERHSPVLLKTSTDNYGRGVKLVEYQRRPG
jgi:hypothetical protein